MPIYDYRCSACRRRSSLYFQTFAAAESTTPACTSCGSTEVTRLVNRVAVIRSEESRLEDLADPSSFGDLDENDPKSIARWARKMGSELGEDMGDEFGEMVEQMEAGEMPDEMSGEAMGAAGDDIYL